MPFTAPDLVQNGVREPQIIVIIVIVVVVLLVARVRVEEKQLLGLSSEGIGCVKRRLYFSPLPLLLFMPWFPSRKLC
jgi:hypothetical protein